MSRKIAVFAVVVLTLFNLTALSTIAYQRWSSGSAARRIPEGEPWMRGLFELGFDERQISQMQEARRQFLERTEPLELELHQLRSRMFDLVRAESPDTSVIFAMVDSIGTVQNELQKQAISHMLDEGSIFTPDQRRRFFEMLDRHKERKWKPYGRQGHGRRGGGRPALPPIGCMTSEQPFGSIDCGYPQPEHTPDNTALDIAQGGH